VRVWDLARGTQVGQPLIGHQRDITALAVGELEGRTVAISGDVNGKVQVWEAAWHTPSRSMHSSSISL
jgi:hypothetical protein